MTGRHCTTYAERLCAPPATELPHGRFGVPLPSPHAPLHLEEGNRRAHTARAAFPGRHTHARARTHACNQCSRPEQFLCPLSLSLAMSPTPWGDTGTEGVVQGNSHPYRADDRMGVPPPTMRAPKTLPSITPSAASSSSAAEECPATGGGEPGLQRAPGQWDGTQS